ncbi:srf-tf-domain-containing partial [Lichtheimia corymbifera JMRC:FSU:9682]|uniref:Srf-tf-domain-containing partial n=1 Tax=Lichtheimia corymbifera JMRC:FSU:9682 TaxID=1263082 RepID=A0A068RZP8_9FUNG|nr:srf-tf-domain-containing partial [Lichtheimia corymbifera JMRC:FSU:9682]
MNQSQLQMESNAAKAATKNKPFEDDNDSDDSDEKPSKRSGRRKIKIEYIEDKNRRHITFSKRKAGIMKKAYELSTLTGTQVLLLVVSETGLVYTFTTVKLQPIVTKPEGKNLIQACLNAPDPVNESSTDDAGYNGQSPQLNKKEFQDKKIDPATAAAAAASVSHPQSATAFGAAVAAAAASSAPGYQQPSAYAPIPQPQQYGPMSGSPAPTFYGTAAQQASRYMQHPNYWQGANNPGNMPRADQQQHDDKARRSAGIAEK